VHLSSVVLTVAVNVAVRGRSGCCMATICICQLQCSDQFRACWHCLVYASFCCAFSVFFLWITFYYEKVRVFIVSVLHGDLILLICVRSECKVVIYSKNTWYLSHQAVDWLSRDVTWSSLKFEFIRCRPIVGCFSVNFIHIINILNILFLIQRPYTYHGQHGSSPCLSLVGATCSVFNCT